MGTRALTLVGAILLASTVALSARNSAEGDCRKAASLVSDGKLAKGGEIYGKVLAGLQKKGDLLGEQDAAKSLLTAYGKNLDTSVTPALAALMAKLDARRSGAFVSAHALAGRLVLAATASGDREHVPAAAKVLKTHARRKNTGVGAAAMAAYGNGLERIAKGEDDAGVVALSEAFKVLVGQGWADAAIHAGVELAAAHVRLGKPRAATDTLKGVESLFPEVGDSQLASTLRKLLARHLPDAGEEVLAPATRAMALHGRGASAGAAGGRGGRGGVAGGIDQSKVGAAMPRFPKSKPLVTAKRTEIDFEIREGFDPAFSAVMPWTDMVKHHDDGGVTLSFFRGTVALAMIDPEGTKGQPGERTFPSPFRAFYYVGKGETWGVTKTGVVTITAR